ncbi:MAG: hypothetical protein IID14_03230 [Candidatus Marinimicrobia bacterium]|nr:hypothetical protein [Candidatus Neomarinimicrobiota bacterium]
MKKIILDAFLVSFLFIHCGEDLSPRIDGCPSTDECIDENGNPYFCIDPDFIAEFGANKIGTNWIYAEKQSGEIDSVTVTYYMRTITQSNLDSLYYETISFILSSSVNDKLFCFMGTLEQGAKSYFFFTYPISNGSGVVKENCEYEGSCLSSVLCQSCTVSVEVIGAKVVNGVTYQDVLMVSGGSTVNPNPIDTFYHANGIGMIRKSYRNGKTYDLLDYQIND